MYVHDTATSGKLLLVHTVQSHVASVGHLGSGDVFTRDKKGKKRH